MKTRLFSKLRTGALLLALLLILPILAACGASSTANKTPQNGGSPPYVNDGSGIVDPGRVGTDGQSSGGQNPNDGTAAGEILKDRKLTRTVDLRMESQKYSELTSLIEGEVLMAGGYIQSSSLSGGESNTSMRQAFYILRIPANKVDSFLEQIKTEGNVLTLTSEIEDITLQYVDTESRLASLRTEQQTLMGILEQANTVEDIITIQDRLTYIRYEIESYESQKRSMDNLVDYSIVNINIREVQDFTSIEQAGFWAEAGRRFTQAWKNLGSGLRTLALGLVSIWPLILLAVIIVVIALSATAASRRKRRNRHQQSLNNPSQSSAKATPNNPPQQVSEQTSEQISEQASGQASGKDEKDSNHS